VLKKVAPGGGSHTYCRTRKTITKAGAGTSSSPRQEDGGWLVLCWYNASD
jgi:hypothetical protein